jgi:Protein kinase domain/WD40-like Beta Propeller Repeat
VGIEARIGAELAGYRLERELGRGGMGVVYLATDLRLGRTVAVKLLSPELSGDEQFRERFIRESRTAAGLEHPNIVPIHAAGEQDGVLFLAMRFIDGSDLRGALERDGRLEPARTARICQQVAAALDAAHRAGLVHRDVKPGNVLLGRPDDGDHAYLSDFGLTKQASSMSGLTATGQLVGTLDYVAPEIIEGRPPDGRADQYALACMAFEMLTGAPPFRREAEAATLWAHIRDAPPELPPDIEGRDAIGPVLARGLAKDPAGRYPSAGDFAGALVAAVPGAMPGGRALTGRLLTLAAAGLALAIAVTAVVTILVFGGGAAAARLARPGTLVALDPRTGAVVGDPIPVGRAPAQVVTSGGTVWVADPGSAALTAVDARTRVALRTLHLGVTPTGLAPAAGGGAWVAAGLARELIHVTPTGGGAYDRSITRIPGCCAGPSTLAAAGGRLYLGDPLGIHVVDPATGRVGPPLATTSGGPVSACGDGAAGPNGHVVFTDGWGQTMSISTFVTPPTVIVESHPGEPSGVVSGGGSSWIAYPRLGEVRGLLAGESASVPPTYHVAGIPFDVAYAEGKLFVASSTGTVTEIQPGSARIGAPTAVGPRVGGITAGDGLVWVTVQAAAAPATATGRILFAADTGLSIRGFASIAAAGGRPRRFVSAIGAMPAISRDRTRLVYAAGGGQSGYSAGVGRGQGLQLQTLPSGQPQLIAGRTAFGPRFSPDGRRLAYWLGRPHGSAVVVARADGSRPRAVWTSRQRLGDLPSLDWSPDASRLVIQKPGQGGGSLAVIDADGRHERPLTLYPAFSPRWSPDGTRIAYLAQVDGAGVYVAGLDGQSYLASPAADSLGWISGSGSVTWSPDGRQLAYAAWAGPGGFRNGEDITVVNADGTGATPITHTGGTGATLPDWIPHP